MFDAYSLPLDLPQSSYLIPGFVSNSRPKTPGSVVGVEISTLTTSRKVYPKVSGAISVEAGLEYEIDGSGTWVTDPGVLTPSNYYRVRLTSSDQHETTTNLDVTVDGTAYTFSVTTEVAPPDIFDDFTVTELDSMTVDEIDETIIP